MIIIVHTFMCKQVVAKYLQKMENCRETWNFTNSTDAAPGSKLEHYPSLLLAALQDAASLVGPFKGVR